jgi:hypothetical protein
MRHIFFLLVIAAFIATAFWLSLFFITWAPVAGLPNS